VEDLSQSSVDELDFVGERKDEEGAPHKIQV